MGFSFPSSPVLNQTSLQNGRLYQWNGYAWDLTLNVSTHGSTHSSSGTDPLTLTSSQISNFNSSVSGLISSNITNASNLYLWSTFR
jgi:hypothetical protein